MFVNLIEIKIKIYKKKKRKKERKEKPVAEKELNILSRSIFSSQVDQLKL